MNWIMKENTWNKISSLPSCMSFWGFQLFLSKESRNLSTSQSSIQSPHCQTQAFFLNFYVPIYLPAYIHTCMHACIHISISIYTNIRGSTLISRHRFSGLPKAAPPSASLSDLQDFAARLDGAESPGSRVVLGQRCWLLVESEYLLGGGKNRQQTEMQQAWAHYISEQKLEILRRFLFGRGEMITTYSVVMAFHILAVWKCEGVVACRGALSEDWPWMSADLYDLYFQNHRGLRLDQML